MNGKILYFRGGLHTQYNNHMILQLEGVSSRGDAVALEGKKVVWKSSSGKEINGTVSKPHGSKGLVRAIFERGMPGQSLGTFVSLI